MNDNLKNPDTLTDEQLLGQTRSLAQAEKGATLALLEYLNAVDARRAYAIGAYSSLFDYVVRGLGYSEAQASERVNAVRLMTQNPEVKLHLQSGAMNLTIAAQVQRFISQEKRLNKVLSKDERAQVIEKCLNHSKRDVESILLGESSAPVRIAIRERTRLLTEGLTEVRMILDEGQSALLVRARELYPDETLAGILERSLRHLIHQKEKQMGRTLPELKTEDRNEAGPNKESSGPVIGKISARKQTNHSGARSRFIPCELKRLIYARSGGQCEWRAPDTDERCRSRSRLQVDHITPLARGGFTEARNLRHLCAAHNARAAMDWGIALPISEPATTEQ